MSWPSDAPEPPADAGRTDDASDRPDDANGRSDDAGDRRDDVVGQPAVPEVDLAPALDRLRIERRILSDERSAFRRFCDRLLAIEDGHVATDAVLSHYRGTVMAVPHYWTEYGDTATESIAAEFGETLARDLEARKRVGDPTVTALRRAGERSLRARDELVDSIDAERHAVATAAEELESIREDLLALHGDEPAATGGTDATRLTLASLRERCDAIANRRRAQLQPEDGCEETAEVFAGTAAPSEASGVDDRLTAGRLQSLCYRELAVNWPVLAGVETLRTAIDRHQRTVLDRESGD